MALLTWDKPKKLRSTEEHNRMHSADCVADGAYAPNMSDADKRKWKAKKIGGKDPRIEIRKTTPGHLVKTPAVGGGWFHSHYEGHAQVLMVVRPNGTVLMSMNSKAEFDMGELEQALAEARVEMSSWHLDP